MRNILFLIGRYLFARKTSLSINIIASISIVGLSIGTAALIIVLSVFNGFEALLSGMFSKYNPDIKIVHYSGKNFHENPEILKKISSIPEIKYTSRVYEQSCMFQYREVQDFGILRAVDSIYPQMISLDSAIVEGELNKDTNTQNFAYLGIGISNKLSVSLENFYSNITVYSPDLFSKKPGLSEENYKRYVIQPRMIFSFLQEADYEVIITDLNRFRYFLGDSTLISSIQLKLNNINSNFEVVQRLKELLGTEYVIKDRYLQDEAFLKIMNLEKWLYFTLFLLTMLLVSFTIVGTLWMAVLEKRMDIAILKSLGMMTKDIQRVFFGMGMGIGLMGMILGFILSLVFYYLQNQYSIIKVPEEFIIDSYPIALKIKDFAIVGFAVMFTVYLACILPAKKIAELDAIFRED